MRWLVVLIFALVLLVFEQGLSTLIEVDKITPSFLLVFVVFLALTAPLEIVPWAAIVLGLMVDLTTFFRLVGVSDDFVLLGPTALAYLTASYVAVQMRGMVFRDSPLSIGVMVFIAGIFAHLVIIAVLTVRGLPMLTGERLDQWDWADELVRRFFSLLYSGVVAVPLAWVLIRLEPLLGITPRTGMPSHRARRVV